MAAYAEQITLPGRLSPEFQIKISWYQHCHFPHSFPDNIPQWERDSGWWYSIVYVLAEQYGEWCHQSVRGVITIAQIMYVFFFFLCHSNIGFICQLAMQKVVFKFSSDNIKTSNITHHLIDTLTEWGRVSSYIFTLHFDWLPNPFPSTRAKRTFFIKKKKKRFIDSSVGVYSR